MKKLIKTDDEREKILTRQQFDILRKKGTEPAGSSKLNTSKEKGKYHCVACNNNACEVIVTITNILIFIFKGGKPEVARLENNAGDNRMNTFRYRGVVYSFYRTYFLNMSNSDMNLAHEFL